MLGQGPPRLTLHLETQQKDSWDSACSYAKIYYIAQTIMAHGQGLLQWYGKDKADAKGKHRIRMRASLSSPPPLRVPRSTSPPVGKCSSTYDQGQCVSLSTQGSPLETQLRAGHLGTLCPTHSKIHTSLRGGWGEVFRSNCVLCANHPGAE